MLESRNGILRSDRPNVDLLDSSFKIDARRFEDIVGYISSFLSKIDYFNAEDEIDGTWDKIIEDDPIVILVQIVTQSTAQLEEYAGLSVRAGLSKPQEKQAKDLLEDWQKLISKWIERLQIMGLNALSDKIDNVFRNVLLDYRHGILSKEGHEASDSDTRGQTNDYLVSISLHKTLHAFLQVVVHIKDFTKKYLEKNIFSSNELSPANSMYYTFALLFRKVQDQINQLHQTHLDFYYKEILGQKRFDGSPTKAIVNFSLLPKIPYARVEKGVKLSAGKLFGSKTDIEFETTETLVASGAELVGLKTLCFNTNPAIRIGTNQPVVSSTLQYPLIVNGKQVTESDQWYLFGANKETQRISTVDVENSASFGFVLSSPVLLLSEGNRVISLKFNMEKTPFINVFWDLVCQVQENRKVSQGTAISHIFRDGLEISYTSTKGWQNVEGYAVDFDEESNYFSLEFRLKSNAPAVEIPKINPDQLKWPSVQVVLNETAPVYLFPFFQGVSLSTIEVDVKVTGVTNLSIWNTVGKMTPGKAFDLFGPLPQTGSFFMLGKSELFQKDISQMNVHLQWESVPEDFGGFEEYYAGYSIPFDNESFQIDMQALSEGEWGPQEENLTPQFSLFSTKDVTTPEGYESVLIAGSSSFEISNFEQLDITKDMELRDPINYTIKTRSGYFRFALTSPSQGFGTDLYPQDLAETAMFNAKHKREQIPLPNKPFIPKVRKVSLDYTASDTLFFGASDTDNITSGANTGEFFHISPNGLEAIICEDKVSGSGLLATFDQEGYLFLDVDRVPQGSTLSFYFHLLHSSTSRYLEGNQLKWELFSSINKWEELSRDYIVVDGTNGFQKSGILKLKMPSMDISQDDEVMSSTADYRLRISTKKYAQHYPRIKGVYLNAVEAVCLSTNPEIIGHEAAALSINKLITKVPDVKTVEQNENSFGGRQVESWEQFYNRVSERLRHKSRAITFWDFERLILEYFDEVKIVKCTNFNKNFQQVPRHVKVVVLSDKWTLNERRYFDNAALARMQLFLQQRANAGIQIEVMNPSAEYLLVNCVVEYVGEEADGYYTRQLNQDIASFLSPVSNIKDGVGGIGSTFNPATLSGYIDNRPYVKSLTKLSIEHIVRRQDMSFVLDVYSGRKAEIRASVPWGVLTPMARHRIWIKKDSWTDEERVNVGIETMEIGTDFIIGDPPITSAIVSPFMTLESPPNEEEDSILVLTREN